MRTPGSTFFFTVTITTADVVSAPELSVATAVSA
jgi:hypothetical protein